VSVTVEQQARVDAWNARFRWPIVVAAIVPFLGRLLPGVINDDLATILDLVSWMVFVIDLVVQVRLNRRYLTTASGLFDLAVVLFTFPWYIIRGIEGSGFSVVLRLVRAGRVFLTGPTARKIRYIAENLGMIGIVAIASIVVASLIVLQVEPPSSDFTTWGDAVWWSMVTLTTVGYGDLFPVTEAGRLAAALLMFVGLGLLGTLAGILSSMFRQKGAELSEPATEPAAESATELAELRKQVAVLEEKIDRLVDRLG
jgi:voltage-gated potassium channel